MGGFSNYDNASYLSENYECEQNFCKPAHLYRNSATTTAADELHYLAASRLNGHISRR